MSEFLQINDTLVQVTDDELGNGFQVGYLDYKVNFRGKVQLTDELLATIVANAFIDVQHTSRCNAGYLIGFFAALVEKEPKRVLPFQIVGKIEATLTPEIGGSCDGQ